MDAVKPLNYAQRPSRSRSYLRLLYRAIWVAALLAATFLWGPGTLRWIDFLYWQNRCQTYQLPPDRVVYELTRGTFFADPKGRFITEPIQGTILQPQQCPPAIHFDPTCNHSTVFLHEMRRPDGQRRIVWLHIPSRWPHPYSPIWTALLCDQWNVSIRPRNLCTWDFINFIQNWSLPNFATINDEHHWKIFAGQIDPENPSHLTFDYEIDSQRHTCDGWLNADGQMIFSTRQ